LNDIDQTEFVRILEKYRINISISYFKFPNLALIKLRMLSIDQYLRINSEDLKAELSGKKIAS